MTAEEALAVALSKIKASSSGVINHWVDQETYTMYWEYADGNIDSITFEPPKDGKDGVDGFSPIVTRHETEEGVELEITDATGPTTILIKNGKDGTNGQDGFSPVITRHETETGVDIEITDAYGSHTISISNGKDGVNGEQGPKGDIGPQGPPGTSGKDGIDGIDGINGQNGKDGLDGQDGNDGISIIDTKINENNHLLITYSDGRIEDAGQLGLSYEDTMQILKEEE